MRRHPSKREWSAEFRELWELEIRQEEARWPGGVLWYWETALDAAADDGNLPQSARNWSAPRWLLKIDAGRSES
jgi:hypothetical protein